MWEGSHKGGLRINMQQLIGYMKADKGKKMSGSEQPSITNKYCELPQFLSYICTVRPGTNDIPHLKLQGKLLLAKGIIVANMEDNACSTVLLTHNPLTFPLSPTMHGLGSVSNSLRSHSSMIGPDKSGGVEIC